MMVDHRRRRGSKVDDDDDDTMDVEPTTEQKLAVASSFLLQSPPGEINDVFVGKSQRVPFRASHLNSILTLDIAHTDVRAMVSDDAALEEGISPALEQYNVEQFITADLEGNERQVHNNIDTTWIATLI
jgi:hypothetical protein